MLQYLPVEVLYVFPKLPHVLLASQPAVPRRQNVEVQAFDAFQGVDPFLDVGVVEVAVRHRLNRDEVDGKEDAFLREPHDDGVVRVIAAHVGEFHGRAA